MTETEDHKTAAVIGLGLMGSALADALLGQDRDLVVWNRTAQKSKRFSDAGATVANSVADAASMADVLIVCLTDHATSMEVLKTGMVADNMVGKALILLSTMSGDESLVTAQWADDHNIGYLDGSILGYPDNVRSQKCMVAYSGPKKLFDSLGPVLNAVGGMPRHVSESAGVAPQFDKACYSLYYAHCIGLIHGAAMCKALGASLDVFKETLTTWDYSIQDSKFMEMIEQRDYTLVDATLDIHAAAYVHVLPLSEKLGVDSGLPKLVTEYFDRAIKNGYGDSELPALIEILSRPQLDECS